MTKPQRSYSDPPQWQHVGPDAPPTLETLKERALGALDKSDTDTLDEVLADMRILCDMTTTRETIHKVFAAIEAQHPDSLRPAIEQLASLIQWERRPQARTVHEIDDDPPVPLLTAAGQDSPLLTSGIVCTMAGAGGTGKSKLALQIALQFAAANEDDRPTPDQLWLTAAGPSLVITYEDAAATTADRLRQQAERLGCPGALARVHVLDLSGWPLFGPPEATSYNIRPTRLPGFDVLVEAAAAVKPRLVVIDPALSAYVGEANAAAPVREFVSTLAQLASQHNAAVLVVAHSTKGTRTNNNPPDPFDPGQLSGSTAWHDATRACLVLIRDGDYWTLAISKANYGPAFIQARIKQDGHAFRAADRAIWKGKDDGPKGGDGNKGDNPYA